MAAVAQVVTLGTVCSVCIIVISIYLRQPEDDFQLRLNDVLHGLIAVEKQYVTGAPKVAVGYGACHDLVVSGFEFLNYDDTVGTPQHYDDINSIEQLKKSYAYYFRHGAAVERYMSNSTLFDELVAAASRINGARYSLGGNAASIAARLHNEGCQVVLGAGLTSQLQSALPNGLNVVGPLVKKDDVHLILEYKAGETWGPYTAPRANRYILHNDNNNPLVSSLEAFEEEVKGYNADLLVISGLQMMDNYPFLKGERESRLLRIKNQMETQPSMTRIHFEMASFSEPHLMNYLIDNIIPYADSLGMNEQELANLVSMYQYGNVSLVTDSNPRVAVVLDQMRSLLRFVKESHGSHLNGRELSRLHVHTLAYQAILTSQPSSWARSDVAAAKSSLTAHRHVCASKKVDLDKAVLIMDNSFSVSAVTHNSERVIIEPNNPVSCWNENDGRIQLCIAPVLVCTHSTQTAGGGDNISAAALSVQL